MPIVNQPGLNVYSLLAQAAAGGAADASRQQSQFQAQLEQRDRQFYDSMRYGAQQDLVNYAQQLDYMQRSAAAQEEAAIREEGRRIENEQAQFEWKFSKSQEQRRTRLQEQAAYIDEIADAEGWDVRDPYMRQREKMKIAQRFDGIEPTRTLKENPWAGLPRKQDPKGNWHTQVPGRNGEPTWKPDDPGVLPLDVQADLDFKREEAIRKEKIEATKAEQQAKLDASKAQNELRIKKSDLVAKLITTQNDEGNAMSVDEAEKLASRLYDDPPVKVTSPEQLAGLPRGTKFIAPDGSVKVIP